MILFETSTSVFELMWDIALALFIIRISFVYFLLTFLTGCIIAYFRIKELQPIYLLTQPQSELITLPIWLLFMTLWARYITVSYEVPRVGGFRLGIGLLALVFLLTAELISGVVLYERGVQEWIWETDPWAGGAGAVVLSLFGLLPLLLMGVEKKSDEVGKVVTSHGHEKKGLVDAVPTVAVVEKGKVNGEANGKETGKKNI